MTFRPSFGFLSKKNSSLKRSTDSCCSAQSVCFMFETSVVWFSHMRSFENFVTVFANLLASRHQTVLFWVFFHCPTFFDKFKPRYSSVRIPCVIFLLLCLAFSVFLCTKCNFNVFGTAICFSKFIN